NNQTFKAEQFQLLSSCNTLINSSCGSKGDDGISFSAGATGYMYVYAPQTNISLGAQTELFGAILGFDIHTNGQPKLHYDKQLSSSGKLAAGLPNYTWASGTWKTCKNPQCT